jgi:L(+)-tartrate dehydratase beta subunit
MKQARLTLPVRRQDLEGLEPGTIVHLDGVLYTGREGLYRRILDEGHPPPVDLATLSNANFHCSPAASTGPDGTFTIGAVTATASFRFSHWIERWFEVSGARLIIGKGGMSGHDYRSRFVPHGAVYLTTVGYGTGALLGRGIRRVRAVHWLKELGIAQAMWVLEVDHFGPFLVDSDLDGNSLFERLPGPEVERLYAGLKAPALRRYGETTSREDEVI